MQQKPNSDVVGVTKVHGKFALSIGTSLAIETLFGVNDNVRPTYPLPFLKYQTIYINVRTLIRNMYGSVQKELKEAWSVQRYFEEISKELYILPQILNDYSGGKLSVVYYEHDLRQFKRIYPNALRRVTKGAVTLFYEALEDKIVEHLLGSQSDYRIAVFDRGVITPPKEKVLFLTHMPIDLLEHTQSGLIDLIESHTGVIKEKVKWYTKLADRDLERIPFNSFTIQVFGDGKTFTAMPIKYRRALKALAEHERWNQLTHIRLMKAVISKNPDRDFKETMLQFF